MIMRRFLLVLLAVAMLVPADVGAAKKIRVVTTIPDLADMTRQVVGDLAHVTNLATSVEVVHAVPMKASFAVTPNRTDVVILMGLQIEHALLPALLEACPNPQIPSDQP